MHIHNWTDDERWRTGCEFGSFYSKLDQTTAANYVSTDSDGQIWRRHEYSAILTFSAEPLYHSTHKHT